MTTCTKCGNAAAYTVVSIQDGSIFCAATGCAPPTFLPHLIYSVEDVQMLQGIGVNAELGGVLKEIFRAATE